MSEGFHLKGVNFPRDFKADVVADIATASKGDKCPLDDGKLHAHRGIEIGHIFKLGTEYSKSMNANFLDEAGEAKPLIMGCYGIGVSRLVGAIVEASHDERGMIFPVEIAPYGVYLASLNVDDAAVVAEADALYEALEDAGIEVLYDDRDEKPGVKFNDADLIGLPVRVVVSRRGVANGQIEIKERTAARPDLVNQADAVKAITDLLV